MENSAKIILKDQTELLIMATSTADRINFMDASDFSRLREYILKFTPENLADFKIQRENNSEIGKYKKIQDITAIPKDLGYLIEFNLAQRDPYEIMQDLMAEQEIQAEAIEDIGAAIAEIAGG